MNGFINRFKGKSVFHFCHSDLDGNGCSLISKIFLEKHLKNYIYKIITKKDELKESIINNKKEIEQADIILFTDLSPYEINILKSIESLNKNIIIVDHHDSSFNLFKDLIPKENYYYDKTVSATKLFYNLLTEKTRKSKIISQTVDIINTYDLYDDSDLEKFRIAVDMNNLLYKLLDYKSKNYVTPEEFYQPFISNMLRKFEEHSHQDFQFSAYELNHIKEAREQEQKYLKQVKSKLKILKDGNGNLYTIVQAQSKLSYICWAILKEYQQIDYLIARSSYYKNKEKKLSLRSRNNGSFHVNAIAEQFAGGGHKSSAGIDNLDDEFFKDVLNGKRALV